MKKLGKLHNGTVHSETEITAPAPDL